MVKNFFRPGQGNGEGPSWRFLTLDRAQDERVRQEGSRSCSLINISRCSLEEKNLCATKSLSPSWPVRGRAEKSWALAETERFLLPMPLAPRYIIKKRPNGKVNRSWYIRGGLRSPLFFSRASEFEVESCLPDLCAPGPHFGNRPEMAHSSKGTRNRQVVFISGGCSDGNR